MSVDHTYPSESLEIDFNVLIVGERLLDFVENIGDRLISQVLFDVRVLGDLRVVDFDGWILRLLRSGAFQVVLKQEVLVELQLHVLVLVLFGVLKGFRVNRDEVRHDDGAVLVQLALRPFQELAPDLLQRLDVHSRVSPKFSYSYLEPQRLKICYKSIGI